MAKDNQEEKYKLREAQFAFCCLPVGNGRRHSMTLLLDIVAVVALLGLCYLVIEHFRLPKDMLTGG